MDRALYCNIIINNNISRDVQTGCTGYKYINRDVQEGCANRLYRYINIAAIRMMENSVYLLIIKLSRVNDIRQSLSLGA